MSNQLRPAYEWGRAQSRRDPWTWMALVILSAACVMFVTLSAVMLPASDPSRSEFIEAPVPSGTWATIWSPMMRPPAAEQEEQVRALRYVASGTAGLVSILCLLVVTALWGQRLRLRHAEHFVHWAVGANRWQAFARLFGEARFWAFAAAVGVVVAIPALIGTLERTFPGHASVLADVKAAAIVLSGLVAGLARWERRSSSEPLHSSQLLAYQLLGSPILIGTAGVAILSATGLLVLHAPYAGSSPVERDGVVVAASMAGLPDGARRRLIRDLAEALANTGQRVGLASAGAARGVGHWDMVATDCGQCSEGMLPTPIQYVRAEVHAVAQDTFSHLGIQLTRGRDFDNRHDVDHPSVAIVSQALANRHFERGEAVGRHVRVGNGDWLTVIGVAQDARDLRDYSEYAVYVPLIQVAPTEIEVLTETTETTSQALQQLAKGGASVAVARPRADVFAVHRWFRALMASVGLAAMVVLAVGLWVAARNEARATRFEVGLRRAVGAQQRDLRRFYAAVVARHVAATIVAGAWLSLFLGAGLREAYGAIPQVDWFTVAAAGAWISIIYVLGSLSPFMGACRMSVLESLGEAT
jgi:hypothetical protein